MIGECLQRQQEFLGPRQARQRTRLVRFHHLRRFREHRRRGDHGRAFAECQCQGCVALFLVVAVIEQQQVDRDDAGLEAGDRIDERGKIGARQRIAALFRHGVIVDGDDGDLIRRGPFSARDQTKIGQRAFGAIEKLNVAAPVPESESERPQRGQHERNQDLEGPAGHWRSWPNITGRDGRAAHRRAAAASA